MDASSGAESSSARAKAEARRQKILARQKDRLNTITGTYAQPEAATTAPVPGRPTEEAPPAVSQAATDTPSSREPRQWQEQQLESLIAAAQARLEQAQATLQEPDSSDAAARHSVGASAFMPAPQTRAAATGNASAPPNSAAGSEMAGALTPYLQLGAKLGAAATRTRPLRLLVAVFLAYALCAGLLDAQHVVLPPVLCVGAMELCIALGGLLLGSISSPGGLQQAEDELEDALPRRLRQFNLTALFPGAKEALRGLLGFRQFVNGLSEDVSAYIVACGLLVALMNYWHASGSAMH